MSTSFIVALSIVSSLDHSTLAISFNVLENSVGETY